MTKDLNKNILSIQYNSLNLPSSITFKDGKTIRYIYGADGRKLKVVYKANNPSITHIVDYCGNMIYENGKLKQMLIDGGYVSFDKKIPEYYYYIQDHLGNNRVVVLAKQISNPRGKVKQVNHYYPYGGLMAESTNWNAQRYKYNGKEFDRMHGLDWYDYGARMYDPALTRWTTMDPLAEVDYNISPYVYCGNNPIIYKDKDGRIFGIDNVIGGIVGAATEVGIQMAANMITDHSLNNISWGQVGVAAAEGFVTSGASTAIRLSAKIGAAVASSAIENYNNGIKAVVKGTVINIAESVAAKGMASGVSKLTNKVAGKSMNKVSNKIISSKSSLKKIISTNTNLNSKQVCHVAGLIQKGQKKVAKGIRKAPKNVTEVGSSVGIRTKLEQDEKK